MRLAEADSEAVFAPERRHYSGDKIYDLEIEPNER